MISLAIKIAVKDEATAYAKDLYNFIHIGITG